MNDEKFKEIFDQLNEDVQNVIIKRTLQALGVGFLIGILIGIMI